MEVDTRTAVGCAIGFMSGAKIAINFPDQRRKRGEHDNMPTWHISGDGRQEASTKNSKKVMQLRERERKGGCSQDV